ELNEKVIDFIFFTNEKGKRQEKKEENGFSRFSQKNMIRGKVYFKGRLLGEIQDIGFNNVEEVIRKLSGFIPDDMPVRAVLHFKIEIVDKGQFAVYERLRGINC
ncbi:MAG: transposase, partial [Muribaculaceae bacterium]|nr:transposase [Muribaculaceae bacterium]